MIVVWYVVHGGLLRVQAVSQVAVGPRLLDFGKVSAASKNVRYLAVSNPLLQNIHVVLAVANLPELKDTESVSQVIPLAIPPVVMT